MRNRQSIRSFFILLTFFIMVFPLIMSFNDALTRLMQKIAVYTVLQEHLVPLEVKVVGFVVRIFGVRYTPLYDGMIVNTYEIKMLWSCLGWQSLLLFGGSLIVGLWGGKCTLSSKLQTVLLGIFGIFWVNILRISFTILLFVYANPVFEFVFHDILAAFVTIVYLLAFWWFSYKYVLEEKVISV